MAGIASIPPVHLTARAVEWLEQATTIFGGMEYLIPMGLAACNKALPTIDTTRTIRATGRRSGKTQFKIESQLIYTHSGWCCGVEDVRAMYLNEPTAIRYKAKATGGGFRNDHRDINHKYTASPVRMPTCVDCLIQLDTALSKAKKKEGRYIKAIKLSGDRYRFVSLHQGETISPLALPPHPLPASHPAPYWYDNDEEYWP